jgi:AraC family transcriptional regulator
MSPYRFVTEKRVERARRMLKTSTLPISEIALACGFSSQQHLTSTLSARLGITPRRIRAKG